MTMKTKRTLAVGGGSAFCAALAVLIATRFAPNDAPITASAPETETKPSMSLIISTAKPSGSKPTEKPNADTSDTTNNGTSNTTPTNIDPEKEAADFIESGGIEIRQDFPEPEKKTESAPTANTVPTEPPTIKNEEMLTDPTKEPTYEPEQTVITPPDTSTDSKINAAMHGQKKDGMIFITGFGWVKDNGGGGRAEYDSEMYENGNKIGSFG